MAIFCIPKQISEKLKESARSGEFNMEKLYGMTSQQRHNFFNSFVKSDELARFINAGFEKAIISEQKNSMEAWVKSTFSVKDKVRKQNALDKIAELSKSGALTPQGEENFLSDLVAEKLGITITAEEANQIDIMSGELEIAFAQPADEYGLPDMSYFEKRQKIETYLKSLTPSSKTKVFTSIIGRGSLLASVKSPIVNIIGNSVQQLETRLENRISSKQYTGKVEKSVMKGYIKRVMEIYNKTGFDVTRMNHYGEGARILGEKIVHSEGKGVIRKIGRFYEDMIFKNLMSVPDVYFSAITFADSVNLGATKMAEAKGLTGKEASEMATKIFKDSTSVTPNTTTGEAIRETAIADALVATFQDDSAYSSLALGIRKLFNDASGDLRIGDQLMPFVKTPANVVGMTLDAGGLGLVKGFYRLPSAVKMMKAGDPSGMRIVAKNFARAGLGMTMAFLISSLFKPEDFIGKWPTSKSEQELLKTKKARENSIRIGNRWISLDYFGFLGGPLVGFLYAKKYGNNMTSAIYSYVSGIVEQTKKIPGFDAMKDVIDSVSSLKPEEGESVGDTFDKAKVSAMDFLRARIIPAIVYDIAKAMDTVEREVDWKDPVERLKSTLPGLRQTLQAKKDVFDAVIKGEPWWSVVLFGARIQTARDNELVTEISRLNDAGYMPVIVSPEKTANSRMAQLKTQLGDEKFAGAMSYFRNGYKTEMTKLLKTRKYKLMSDEDKKKEIDAIRTEMMEKTLKRYRYKKPKEVKKDTSMLPDTEKGQRFKLVKQAFASEGLEGKKVYDLDMRSGLQKAMDWIGGLFTKDAPAPEPPTEMSDQQRKDYKVALQLRSDYPEWYKENIGSRGERSMFNGMDLNTDNLTADQLRDSYQGEDTPVKINKTEEYKAPKVTKEPRVLKEDEVKHFNERTKEIFADVGEGDNALRVLDGENKGRVIRRKPEDHWLDYNYKENANGKVTDYSEANRKMIKNQFTGKEEWSEDRGLWRINNETFYTYLGGKKERQEMYEAGIIPDPHLEWKGLRDGGKKAEEYWELMYDPELNAKMAKIIFKKQGWDAWAGAPPDLLSEKRKKHLGLT